MSGASLVLFNPAGLPLPAGWDGAGCALSRDLTVLAPDLVIAADAALGKRTGHPWLGWLRDDPDRLRHDRRRLDCVLSHDGFIVENPAQAQFLTDTLSATGRPAHILTVADLAPGPLSAMLGEVRAAAGFTPTGPAASVDYIVRVGGRDIDFVRRCLDSLAAQTSGGIGVILVRYAPVPGLEAEMERQRLHFRRLDLIDIASSPIGPTTRSACLWAGLQVVQADLFGMLDDDDALHPNHVASLTPLALAGSIAIAGSVQVWDDVAGPFPPPIQPLNIAPSWLLPISCRPWVPSMVWISQKTAIFCAVWRAWRPSRRPGGSPRIFTGGRVGLTIPPRVRMAGQKPWPASLTGNGWTRSWPACARPSHLTFPCLPPGVNLRTGPISRV